MRGHFVRAAWRGVRGRCPRCGVGRLFRGVYTALTRCSSCGLDLEDLQGGSWGFMYIFTAGLTGMFVITMFLLRPRDLHAGRVTVGILAAVVFAVTMRPRKGLAIALDWAIRVSAGES